MTYWFEDIVQALCFANAEQQEFSDKLHDQMQIQDF